MKKQWVCMLLNDVRKLLITVQLQLSLYEGCRCVYIWMNPNNFETTFFYYHSEHWIQCYGQYILAHYVHINQTYLKVYIINHDCYTIYEVTAWKHCFVIVDIKSSARHIWTSLCTTANIYLSWFIIMYNIC